MVLKSDFIYLLKMKICALCILKTLINKPSKTSFTIPFKNKLVDKARLKLINPITYIS